MKNIIILCSPTSEDFKESNANDHAGFFFPPLGLLLVAQTLKNARYEVKFYDGYGSINYKKDLFKYVSLNHEKILFIGFYLAILQLRDFIEIIKYVKTVDEDIPIVAGGPFPSAFPGLVMRSRMVDVCCIGDGAEVAKWIADSMANGKSLYHIPNVSFIKGGGVASSPKNHRDSLNEDNNIFYDNFIDIESYANKFNIYLTRDYDSSIRRAIPVLTGLGCSYKCAFCENSLLGHSHISLPAENLAEQIIYYQKKFDINSFSFFDEDFFIDKTRLFKFLELVGKKDLKIKWGTQCRANYFNERYINDKLLAQLEKAGCVRLSIGIESGSPKILKKIRKGIRPEQAIAAAEYGRNSAIYFSYSFMVNLPDETRKDLHMSFDLIDKLLSIKKNSFISAVHYYIAYPGTPLSIEAEKKLDYKIEDRISFEQFGNLSLEEYNSLVNPKKKDIYRECVIYYYHRLNTPFRFKLDIKSIYHDIFRVIGMIRKRLNFYHLPLEMYLINLFKIIRRNEKRSHSC